MFTFAMKTFGCQMNVADSDEIARHLAMRGGIQVTQPEIADIVIVNTCVVREKAEQKAYSFIGALKPLKLKTGQSAKVTLDEPKVRPLCGQADLQREDAHKTTKDGVIIAVIGCLVPKSADFVREKFPYVDVLVGTSEPSVVLAELEKAFEFPIFKGAYELTVLEEVRGARALESCTESAIGNANALDDAPSLEGFPSLMDVSRSALVTVIRGCNHVCSFCIVPKVRGRETSVPIREVVRQVKAYREAGFNEVTLLGQNILSYGSDYKFDPNFVDLVDAVLAQTDVPWLSYLTSHPYDLTDEIIEKVVANPRVTPLLHLPVQAGSDRILGLMRRKYTVKEYLEKVDKARQARPDLFLTTDIIVGFPGETREEFEETLRLVEKVRFNDAFMFAFSPRKGTLAAKYDDPQSRQEKKLWLNELIHLQREISQEVNRKYLGQVLPAVLEVKRENFAIARTAFNKPVELAFSAKNVGEFTTVRIDEVNVSSFKGVEVASG